MLFLSSSPELAQEGDDACGHVLAVDPAETVRFVVKLVQRRLGAVQPVQVAHQQVQFPVRCMDITPSL